MMVRMRIVDVLPDLDDHVKVQELFDAWEGRRAAVARTDLTDKRGNGSPAIYGDLKGSFGNNTKFPLIFLTLSWAFVKSWNGEPLMGQRNGSLWTLSA